MSIGVELTTSLYRAVRGEPGNLCISPYSVWSALALVYPGARGTTRSELDALLGPDVLSHSAEVRGELAERAKPPEWARNRGAGFVLDVGNQVWVQSGYRVEPTYATELAQAFGVDPRVVDFQGSPAEAAAAINRWVSDATGGKIPTLVSARTLSPLTRLLLANSVYFKAAWHSRFSEHFTTNRPFYPLTGDPVDVPTMARIANMTYADIDGVRAVWMPYVRFELAMAVIVPPRGHFDRVDAALGPDLLARLYDARESQHIDLRLPKFSFETTLDLRAHLPALGLSTGATDLSGISQEPGLELSSLIHRTVLEVDERGTEAAAVTAAMVAGAAIRTKPPQPIELHVDSPFYVAVVDLPSNTWLFFARVVAP